MERKRICCLWGLLFFAIDIILTIFVFFPIQWKWELVGLVITELGILVLGAVAGLVIFRFKFSDMLPIKLPKWNHWLGVIVFAGGFLMVNIMINLTLAYFFPSMLETNDALNDIMDGIPYIVQLFIVAVMPAICEETLHRGFILSSFRRFKNKWVIIVIMGVLFGLFHIQPEKYLATGALGCALTYLMISTDNFVMPMTFHFLNNGVAITLSYLMNIIDKYTNNMGIETQDATLTSIPLFYLGIYFILFMAVPFIIYGGALLIKGVERIKREGNKKLGRGFIISGCITGTMLVLGVICIFLGAAIGDITPNTAPVSSEPFIMLYRMLLSGF